jgi:hypothetical protein
MFITVYKTARQVGGRNMPIIKKSIYWDITPCSPLKVNLLSWWFVARLILRPWRWRRRFAPKRWLIFNGLHRCENLRSYMPIIYGELLATRPNPLAGGPPLVGLFNTFASSQCISQSSPTSKASGRRMPRTDWYGNYGKEITVRVWNVSVYIDKAVTGLKRTCLPDS